MVTVAKHRPTKPHIKVQAAAEHLASVPGATLQSAAKHCGLSVPRLRELLAYPHNLAYVKKVRDLAIEALTTSGPATLAKVIAEDSNKMATVAAVKTAHLLQRSAAEESGRLSAISVDFVDHHALDTPDLFAIGTVDRGTLDLIASDQ